MSNLSIKDVPEDWAEALRQRAARNHRSLQGELMAIIEQAVRQETDVVPPAARAIGSASGVRTSSLDRRGWPIVHHGTKTVAQVAEALKASYPMPINPGPSSIELIREDRDSR